MFVEPVDVGFDHLRGGESCGAPGGGDGDFGERVAGTADLWVLAPRIETTPTSIWMEYGHPDPASVVVDPGPVWTAGTLGVWHLGEEGVVDSAAGNTGMDAGSVVLEAAGEELLDDGRIHGGRWARRVHEGGFSPAAGSCARIQVRCMGQRSAAAGHPLTLVIDEVVPDDASRSLLNLQSATE